MASTTRSASSVSSALASARRRMRTPVTRRPSCESRRPTTSQGGAKRTAPEGPDACPNAVLEQRPADAHHPQPRLGAREAVPAEQQPSVAEHVTDGRAVRHQLVGQAGEQLLQRQLAAGEQGVDVTALRRAAPRGDAGRERVAVQHRDLRISVGEHSGGEQPGDASAEHDGVILHRGDLLWSPRSVPRRGARFPGRFVLSAAQAGSASCRRARGPTGRRRRAERPARDGAGTC